MPYLPLGAHIEMLRILPYLGSKALLLLITALSVHVSLSPPNPPVKKEDQIYSVQKLWIGSKTRTTYNSPIIEFESHFEKVVLWVTFCSKVCQKRLFFFEKNVDHSIVDGLGRGAFKYSCVGRSVVQ